MLPDGRPPRLLAAVVVLLAWFGLAPPGAAPARLVAQEAGATAPMPRPGSLDPVTYHRQREALLAAWEARDHARVLALSDSLVAVFPHDSEVWGVRGVSALSAGRPELAVGALRHGYELGTYAQPYVALRAFEAWAQRGRRDSAYAWLERALAAGLEDRIELQEDERARPFLPDTTFRRLAGLPLDSALDRDERWRRDLDFLVTEIRRLRPHPRGPALPPAAGRIAAELREAIPGLSDEEIVDELARLVAALGDGHSVLYRGRRWGSDAPPPQLPLVFWLFPDGLHVVDADSAHAELIGSRVDAFGGLDPREVLRRLEPWIARDNAMTPAWLGVRFYLRSPRMLSRVGAADDDGRVELGITGRDGTSRTEVVAPSTAGLPRKLRPAPGVATPAWLSRVDETIWMERRPEHDALYVQFNQVRDPEGGSLAAFADSMGAELRAAGARTLIVDVRHNNGGNNGLLRPLIRRMIAWETGSPGGEADGQAGGEADRRIFVLMGRNTFSAAQNFLNRVERWTDAVFVGEPASSRPNMIGESTNVVLPHSRLWVSVSSRYWQDSDPGDERPWIAPDVPVPYTAADHFAGRDPAMEAVLAILAAGRG